MNRLLLALAAAALVAGCGDEGETDTDSAADQDAARVKLAQCLREHGIDVPDNFGSGGGAVAPAQMPSDAEMRRADEACKEERDAAFGEITPEQRQEFEDAFARFASCMRRNGVDLPDPSEERVRVRIDGRDPAVREAEEQCREELPEGGPGMRFEARP